MGVRDGCRCRLRLALHLKQGLPQQVSLREDMTKNALTLDQYLSVWPTLCLDLDVCLYDPFVFVERLEVEAVARAREPVFLSMIEEGARVAKEVSRRKMKMRWLLRIGRSVPPLHSLVHLVVVDTRRLNRQREIHKHSHCWLMKM